MQAQIGGADLGFAGSDICVPGIIDVPAMLRKRRAEIMITSQLISKAMKSRQKTVIKSGCLVMPMSYREIVVYSRMKSASTRIPTKQQQKEMSGSTPVMAMKSGLMPWIW